MNKTEVKLPDNKSFGIFFSIIFILLGVYLFLADFIYISIFLFYLSLIFFLISIIKPNELLQLNRFWMRLGFILNVIISPIILGIIYFGLFSIIAFFMKIYGRDELILKLKTKKTYWKDFRNKDIKTNSFNQQF